MNCLSTTAQVRSYKTTNSAMRSTSIKVNIASNVSEKAHNLSKKAAGVKCEKLELVTSCWEEAVVQNCPVNAKKVNPLPTLTDRHSGVRDACTRALTQV